MGIIHAAKPAGFTESEIRTISENARTLKFDDTDLTYSPSRAASEIVCAI